MPNAKLISPNITNSEAEFTEDVDFATVQLDTIMTLSQLIGWVDATKSTKFVRVDADGNLLVSTLGTASEDFIPSVASVLTTATLIVASRAERRNLSLYNAGTDTVYISSDSAPLVASGYPLLSGATYSIDNFIGELYGIVATTTSAVRVNEVV